MVMKSCAEHISAIREMFNQPSEKREPMVTKSNFRLFRWLLSASLQLSAVLPRADISENVRRIYLILNFRKIYNPSSVWYCSVHLRPVGLLVPEVAGPADARQRSPQYL